MQATLDTIPGYTNHVYGPNLDHRQTDIETRYTWMEHYLKDDAPALAKATTYSAFEDNEGREVTFILDIPNSVSITESQLWYAITDVPEPDRTWLSLNIQKLDDTTYIAQLTPEMVETNVKYFGSFKDNNNNWISSEMHIAEELIWSGENFDHNMVTVRNPANFNNIPYYVTKIAPELLIRNQGLNEELNVPIVCKINSGDEIIYSDTKTIEKLKSFEIDTVVFKDWKPADINTYDITYNIELTNDEDISSNTLNASLIITDLMDDFESRFGNWFSNGTWGVDSRKANSGQYCMAINPGQNYEGNTNTFAQYRYSLDLTTINNPHLTFWSQTSMSAMAGIDHGFIEISKDDGSIWEKIGENYKSMHTTWEKQIISLQDYAEYNNILIRFGFTSDIMFNGAGWFIDDIKIEDSSTDINDETNNLPMKYNLFDNYPNPFNPNTVMQYSIPKNESVKLKVYNMIGENIATLVDEYKQAGTYSVDFVSNGLPSGVYFYEIKAGNFNMINKMLLLK